VMSHFAAIGVPGILGPTKTRSGQLWSERGGVAAYLSYPGLSSKDPTAKNHSTSSAVYFRPPVFRTGSLLAPYWRPPSAKDRRRSTRPPPAMSGPLGESSWMVVPSLRVTDHASPPPRPLPPPAQPTDSPRW
jgi:hypothetical protein